MIRKWFFPLVVTGVVVCSQLWAVRVNFPQVADGGGISTTFTLINTGNSSVTGILTLLNQNGTPRTLRLNGNLGSSFQVTVPGGGGTVRLASGNEGPPVAGWAYFDSPSINVQGVATFDLRASSGALLTTTGVLGSGGIRKAGLPVEVVRPSRNTGAAIAALGQDVTVMLHLIDQNGVAVASVLDPRLNPLAADNQIAVFVNELFPAVPGINNFRGGLVAEVLGTGQVALTSLVMKESLLSAVPIVEFNAVTSARLKADYQFQSTLSSAVAGAPNLNNVGSNTFGSKNVDGNPRTVLNFSPNNGLTLSPTVGVTPNDAYTIAVLFSFENATSWRKILDFKNGTVDRGLFVLDGRLVFYNESSSSIGASITPGTFVQVVLTRDADRRVVGYVNGVMQFQFTDVRDAATISDQNTLRFFNNIPVAGDTAAGSVARVRIYDNALSADEVAFLDRLP